MTKFCAHCGCTAPKPVEVVNKSTSNGGKLSLILGIVGIILLGFCNSVTYNIYYRYNCRY